MGMFGDVGEDRGEEEIVREGVRTWVIGNFSHPERPVIFQVTIKLKFLTLSLGFSRSLQHVF